MRYNRLSTAPIGSSWSQHRRSAAINADILMWEVQRKRAHKWLMAQPERKAIVQFLRKRWNKNTFADSLYWQLIKKGYLTNNQVAKIVS